MWLIKNLDFKQIKRYFFAVKIKVLILTLIFTVVTAFAGAFFEFFLAKSTGTGVKLEWKTGEEKNIKSFEVERRTLQSGFISIAAIAPRGNNSYYTFNDENAYKPNDVVFIYRIKILDNDNTTSYSKEITVTHSVSGIKKTWGSIKAMFR
jgi:hypothetical protein